MKSQNQSGYILLTLFMIAAMAVTALFLPARIGLVWAWLINLVLMFVIMGIIGLTVGRRFWAIFVDNRNMVSLSRFQVVIWTLVILSAFWTSALGRVADSTVNPEKYICSDPAVPCSTPADLNLPAEVWALMGISMTSSVAATLIKENKGQEAVTFEGDPERNRGALAIRPPAETPQFADMFHTETAGSKVFVDMSKVQNFFFTIVAVLTYATALGGAMIVAKDISTFQQFPILSDGLIGILGISHAGYLTSKVVSRPQQK